MVLLMVLGLIISFMSCSAEKPDNVPVHILGSDGFVRDWLILGAFPNPRSKQSTPEWAYHKDYLNSLGGEKQAKLLPGTEISFRDENGTSQIARTVSAQTSSSGVFHFNSIYGNTNYELAYAFCYIRSEREQQVTAYFGSNDQAKVWVNGELVHESRTSRSCTARQDSFTFQLKKGLNPILIKICEAWGDWAFVIEVFSTKHLSLESQRPLARALEEIQRLDLCLKDYPGDVFNYNQSSFPTVQWRNPYEVEKLLGKFPVNIRWFDAQDKEVERPRGIGSYTAIAEGVSPDGITIRRAKRFECKKTGFPGTSEKEITPKKYQLPSATLTNSGSNISLLKILDTETDNAVALSFIAPVKERHMADKLPAGTYPKQMDRSVRNGQTCLYWLHLPENYGKTEQEYPMILFLHGSFVQGRDLSRIGKPVPPPLKDIKDDFPFVVVTPQCPDEYDAWPSDLLADLIDDVVQKYSIDSRRVYVTGVSLGGRGCWSFACDYPERVAAIVPVCGTYDHPEKIHQIKDVPVWAFHGDQDMVVKFTDTSDMVEKLKGCGGNVRFTVYEGAGHNISGRVYHTSELYKWLLRQSND
jgi:poly(3-hydroxybutyrate) depolymerase